MYICIYQIIPEKGFEINATMEPTNLQQTIFYLPWAALEV